LSTALVTRPAPDTREPAAATAPPPRRALLRRLGRLRSSSPGRLQLFLGVLITLGLLTGLVAGLVGRSAAAGTADLGDRAQPLLIEAETIYSALADANTTAAQAFLAGGLEPAALTRRYDGDLSRATTALTSAARRTPDDGAAAGAIRALSTGVTQYAALVATARAVNRQGLPVGASYLAAASDLHRSVLLPQAQALFRIAQDEVRAGYRSARGIAGVVLLAVLLIVLLGALLAAQRHLSRSMHRTFNVPLVGATAVTALLAIGTLLVLTGQNVHLHRAGTTGSTPAAELAEARILALRERGDEALTLAARGSGGDYQKDFVAAAAAATTALENDYLDDGTRAAHRSYVAAHQEVRKRDDGGDYDGAVKLAVDPGTTSAFESVTGDIGTALEQRKAAFTDQIGAAARGLGLLTLGGPLAALAVCLLAGAGIRARLEEYR
jgi:hypothetical protein